MRLIAIFHTEKKPRRRKLKAKPRRLRPNGRARLNPDAPILAQIRGMLG